MKYFIIAILALLLTGTVQAKEIDVNPANVGIYKFAGDITVRVSVDTGKTVTDLVSLEVWPDNEEVTVAGKSVILDGGNGGDIMTARLQINNENVESFYLNFKVRGDTYRVKLKIVGSNILTVS